MLDDCTPAVLLVDVPVVGDTMPPTGTTGNTVEALKLTCHQPADSFSTTATVKFSIEAHHFTAAHIFGCS